MVEVFHFEDSFVLFSTVCSLHTTEDQSVVLLLWQTSISVLAYYYNFLNTLSDLLLQILSLWQLVGTLLVLQHAA